MAIKSEWIRYGEGSGYFAWPEKATGPVPGVVVIQEIGGVNEHIEDVTRRIAAAGYAALAPDLFAVDGKRPPALTGRGSRRHSVSGQRFRGRCSIPPHGTRRSGSFPMQTGAGSAKHSARCFPSPRRGARIPSWDHSTGFRHLHEERTETRGRKVALRWFLHGRRPLGAPGLRENRGSPAPLSSTA